MTNFDSDIQTPALLASSRRSEFPAVYDISTDENRRKAFTSAVLEFFGPDGFDSFPADDSHLEEA